MEFHVYIIPPTPGGAILAGMFASYDDALKDAKDLEAQGHKTYVVGAS